MTEAAKVDRPSKATKTVKQHLHYGVKVLALVYHRTITTLFVAAVCAVVVFAVLQFTWGDTGYSLNAAAELVSIDIRDQTGAKARLSEVRLPARDRVYYASSLRLLDGATVTMQRLRKNDVRMSIDWPGSDARARLISQDGEEIPLSRNETLVIPTTQGAMTLAFKGTLRLGQQTARDIEGVLLSGHVTIARTSLSKRERYLISDATLDAGDTPLWEDRSGNEVDVAGFVHVSENEAMQVVAHADAHHVTIQRYGGRDYEIKAEWWDRFAHDPYLSSSAALFAFLSTLLMIYELWGRVVARKPAFSKGDDPPVSCEKVASAAP